MTAQNWQPYQPTNNLSWVHSLFLLLTRSKLTL